MSFLFKAGERQLESTLTREIEMTEARELTGAGGRQLESTLTREIESTEARELETVAKGFKHEVQDSQLALKLAREMNAGTRLAGAGEGAGKFVQYAAPGALTALGIYNLQQLPGRLIDSTETAIQQIPDSMKKIIGGVRKAASETEQKGKDTFEKAKQDVAEGLRNHMPNKSDITETVEQALSTAQDTAAAVHLTDTALTIGVVLLGSVVVYEAFRYFQT